MRSQLIMCRFLIDDLLVSFPYPHVYPEQYQYMKELKRILDSDVRFRTSHFVGACDSGDAHRDRQDCVPALPDSVLH